LRGLSLAGIPRSHFQKFSICCAYVKSYGLPPSGRIFTELKPATEDNVRENNNIDKTDIDTKQDI